jgi:hypothetical protein
MTLRSSAHDDLLAIARRVRGAVQRDDADGLHSELSRLRTALMDHVQDERKQLDGLAPSAASVALDGQQRLLRLVTDVLLAPAGRGDDDCNCVVRAAEIELALRRQARLEATLLRSRPLAGGAGR